MQIGAPVLCDGKPGIIQNFQENKNLMGDGVDYVYYIIVKLIGSKHAGPYHPDDVQEGKIVTV